jgi:cell shape-determining protein MreC
MSKAMDKYEEMLNEIEILKVRVEQLEDDKRDLQETLRLIANSSALDEMVALARAALS